ncbi:cupin domain-containing protein [Rhodococcus jostii]|uniref:cupin domain-containing protein n=1 Tax=Rhodococcus jostii TaxID=132919 RepID=UPI00365A8C86
MTTDSVTQGVAHSVNGRLPELDFENRPSGAKLGIFDLPKLEVSVAPFTLAHIRVPAGVTTAEDHHEVREIWLVQSGSGILTLDGVQSRVQAGDTLYYESYRRHQLHNDGDSPVEIVSIWWRP